MTEKFSNFAEEIKDLTVLITSSTISLYHQILEEFLPLPSKSHYIFNLRDISRVFSGLMNADRTHYDTKEPVIRLWTSEVMV